MGRQARVVVRVVLGRRSALRFDRRLLLSRMHRINSLVPELRCADFDASLHFYREVVGFSVGQRCGDDKHAYLTLGNSQIMIANWEQDGTWESGPYEYPHGRGINLQILVEDARAFRERIREVGVEVLVELYTTDYWRTHQTDERTEFAVLDPDRYMLRFRQIETETPHTQARP